VYQVPVGRTPFPCIFPLPKLLIVSPPPVETSVIDRIRTMQRATQGYGDENKSFAAPYVQENVSCRGERNNPAAAHAFVMRKKM
jgi:hypothetical protein